METKSDIIAELRSVAFSMKVHDAMMSEVHDILCGVAFRLEAAWKREKAEAESDALAVGGIVEAARTTEKSSAVGNAAAIREALVSIAKIPVPPILVHVSSPGNGIIIHEPEPESEWIALLRKSVKLAKAALSAPARNCDLARDWLQDLYCKFNPPAIVRREMPPEWVDAVMAFCKWLLAPAAERKGEGDVR